MTSESKPPTDGHDAPGTPTSQLPAAKSEPIYIGAEDRYDRLRLIGWWDQKLLKRARIMVVGAGALGNEVIKNLALLGVGHVLIVDFDRVETSNLSRAVLFRESDCGQSKAEVAARMAAELNPEVRWCGRDADILTDIGLGVFEQMDLVIGCVDNREARLWINRMCWRVSKPWVDGGIQEINGVAKTFLPPEGACYECTMTDNDYRLMHLRYSCPLLKREDIQQGKVPTSPTIAALVGALQTQEALKILHGRPVGEGVGLVFNGDANRFYETRFPRREDCLSHETYEKVIGIRASSWNATANQVLDLGRKVLGWEAEEIELDRDVLVAWECGSCQLETPVNQAQFRAMAKDASCPACGRDRHPVTRSCVRRDDPIASMALAELGVPPYDILKVKGGDRLGWLRLDEDAPTVWGTGNQEVVADERPGHEFGGGLDEPNERG